MEKSLNKVPICYKALNISYDSTIYYSMPHQDNTNNEDKDNFVNYRLNKLEEVVTSLVQNLATLKDIVVRWDSKMGESGWPLKCALHQERMDNLHKNFEELRNEQKVMKTEIQEMKSVIWKASGALIVLSIVVQLLGPLVMEKMFGSSQQPNIEYVQPK